MSHTIETGSRIIKFQNITSITTIDQIKDFDYVFLVQNEDTIDIWGGNDRVRCSNELVHYYEAWNSRQINETDFIVLGSKKFYF
jgi:hypothetical protein